MRMDSKKLSAPPVAVDLFCGAGGLSYGMQQAGVTISGGIDLDPSCRHPFETNVKATFYERDISELSVEFVSSLFPIGRIKILAGCAPCQPFSTYTNGCSIRKGQWQLLYKFGEIIKELQPEIVTMENVPQLTKHTVFKDFISVLEELNYDYSHSVVQCAAYGVPQKRSRLVLMASRTGEIKLASSSRNKIDYVTVRDAIQHLESLEAGSTSDSDPLHKSSRLSKKNLQRIRNSRPGGTWRDWDDDLRTPCHKRNSGRTYSSVYGRMRWDQPAPTITTQFNGYGTGRFGHPDQDRAISLREGAILQTFPEHYSFVPEGETIQISSVARLIGNAVPVKLGEAIGQSIMRHLESLP